MKFSKPFVLGLVLLGMVEILALAAGAQAVKLSRRGLTALPDTAVGSLAVSVTPSAVSFTLVSKGTATGSSAINVTTSWNSTTCSPTCTVNLYGYFTSSTSALTAATGGSIATSEVLGKVPTGTPTAFTAFTQTGVFGAAGASLLLFSQAISGQASKTSRTDALSLEINLSSQPQQPAGTYTGTLYIEAQTL